MTFATVHSSGFFVCSYIHRLTGLLLILSSRLRLNVFSWSWVIIGVFFQSHSKANTCEELKAKSQKPKAREKRKYFFIARCEVKDSSILIIIET